MSTVSRRLKDTYTVVVKTLRVEEILTELSLWINAILKVYFSGGQENEIEKICAPSKGFHSSSMTVEFARALKSSKLLEEQCKVIFGSNGFVSSDMVASIVQAKKWGADVHPIMLANVSHCLHSLCVVNMIHGRLVELSQEKFNKSNQDHVDLLNRLWTNLKPDTTRTGGLVTSEWGEVGFQGTDPSSDFRGMGLLGLVQLVYFSTHRQAAAIALLRESNHSRRYFPFAATGINMTNFVMELLAETRCHKMLFDHLEMNSLSDLSSASYGPETSGEVVEAGCSVIHSLFCRVYEDFIALWVERDPQDIMSFGAIFGEIKKRYRRQYHEL